MIKTIIFDLDGVLIESKEIHYKALNAALPADFRIGYEEHLSTYDGLPTKQKLQIMSKTMALPYGLHGIHGRSLPIAFGVKMANPDLNVITVAGDGDFLSIGMEHIAPQATRNLDICSVVMDNGVYGLTKGQSSPTTDYGVKTTSTPYGKIEDKIHPLKYYLTIGASFIASGYSSKPRDLAKLIQAGMEHPGFAVVHVQSPCTTYNDTYEILKGNAKKGVPGLIYDIPEEYDRTDRLAAEELINSPGIPVGIIYEDKTRASLTAETKRITESVKSRDVAQLLSDYDF